MNRRSVQYVEASHGALEWYREDLGIWLPSESSIGLPSGQREISRSAFAAFGPNPYNDFCITCGIRMGFVEGAYCEVVWDRKIKKWVPERQHVYCHQAKRAPKQNRVASNSEIA